MNGMSIIVKKVTQLLSGLIFMYGAYIVIHGHLTPGGGFAGGAIIAGAFILLILAFGTKIFRLRKEETQTSMIEGLALFIIMILALAGMLSGVAVFFENYWPAGTPGELISAGIIPLYNILIGIKVAAALLTIFLGLVIYKEEVAL